MPVDRSDRAKSSPILFAIFFFVLSLLSFFLMLGEVNEWRFDKALSDPTRALQTTAEVLEYGWARSGKVTYQFSVTDKGPLITGHGSIGRWDYDDLAKGRTKNIKVSYLRDDPGTNAPSRQSSSNVTGDVAVIVMAVSMGLFFGSMAMLGLRSMRSEQRAKGLGA